MPVRLDGIVVFETGSVELATGSGVGVGVEESAGSTEVVRFVEVPLAICVVEFRDVVL